MTNDRVTVHGSWYARGSTGSSDAALELYGKAYRLRGGEHRDGSVDELNVRAPLANAPSRIEWPDGSVFESPPDKTLESWLDAHHVRGRLARRLNRAERRPVWIVASVLLTMGIAIGMYRYGLPALAKFTVKQLPVAALERLSAGALEALDAEWLSPSALEPSRLAALAERFDAMVEVMPDDGFDYRLAFRRLGDMPNAFALPDGQIVVLDGLVDLAETPDEIDSVLLHEIGHVTLRHGVRTLLQSRVIELITTLSTGSASGLSKLASQLGSQLLKSAYSREAEREADAFAFNAMTASDRDPAAFAVIIRRLAGDGGGAVLGWMSSHPNADERAERALAAGRQRGRVTDGKNGAKPGE